VVRRSALETTDGLAGAAGPYYGSRRPFPAAAPALQAPPPSAGWPPTANSYPGLGSSCANRRLRHFRQSVAEILTAALRSRGSALAIQAHLAQVARKIAGTRPSPWNPHPQSAIRNSGDGWAAAGVCGNIDPACGLFGETASPAGGRPRCAGARRKHHAGRAGSLLSLEELTGGELSPTAHIGLAGREDEKPARTGLAANRSASPPGKPLDRATLRRPRLQASAKDSRGRPLFLQSFSPVMQEGSARGSQ